MRRALRHGEIVSCIHSFPLRIVVFVAAMTTGMIAVRWMRARPAALKALRQS
jgi:hypothetical protein